MIIVVDTNVFVSACLGQGACLHVVSECLKGVHTPLMGAALYAELEDVLGRKPLFLKSRLNLDERNELFDIFLATCRWTRIYFAWRPNLKDEADNHLIELAVAGGSSRIVTNNVRDFRNPELKFLDCVALTPTQFLQEQT